MSAHKPSLGDAVKHAGLEGTITELYMASRRRYGGQLVVHFEDVDEDRVFTYRPSNGKWHPRPFLIENSSYLEWI